MDIEESLAPLLINYSVGLGLPVWAIEHVFVWFREQINIVLFLINKLLTYYVQEFITSHNFVSYISHTEY